MKRTFSLLLLCVAINAFAASVANMKAPAHTSTPTGFVHGGMAGSLSAGETGVSSTSSSTRDFSRSEDDMSVISVQDSIQSGLNPTDTEEN